MMAAASKTFEDVKSVILSAHKNATAKDKVDFYNCWAKNYEQDLVLLEYRAANLAASRVSSHFSGFPEAAFVLDVACGTGLVAKQMKENGFEHFVGVDGSEGMLERARETGLYQDLKLSIMGKEPLPAEWANSFDVVLIVGALSPSQVPVPVVRDLCRTTKPGGYICMTTRGNQDNLQYKTSLENELTQMEKEGLWTCVEVTDVENWEKAVAEFEDGYIPGTVYLYKKSV
ncbi:methyltransferase-like protein 27 [Gouania willdenowi]|uniref:Methyltransferase-like protein 27 n=1 Tax=Gouania willdenowi TaxID=441366 RepID=A0A8C5D8K8_GOUWI|nr:methyltransferase-like protein 27 [Gouania willdenowi]XP_028322837.1 methyltransferase-like protein 27 [Gouania willdenowi]